MDGPRVRTRTNRSGGVQGDITDGEMIYFRVASKPTATIMREHLLLQGPVEHRGPRETSAACSDPVALTSAG